MSAGTLTAEAVGFRRLLIDALWDGERFGYVDEDCFIGTCPVCGAAIGCRFAGWAPRATLNCHGGCSEAQVVAAVGRRVAA